jgi:hypothetical protein
MPIDFASFKQGITTDTSAGSAIVSAMMRVAISAFTICVLLRTSAI